MEARVLKVLRELENVNDRESLFWNVPRTTGEFLNIQLRIMNARKALEIGTSNGYSGIFLAEGLSHNKGLLYTVESNSARYDAAAENFAAAGLEKYVRQIKGHAPEVLAELCADGASGDGGMRADGASGDASGGLFDFIFIDATKIEYKSYIEILIPKLRTGGVIIADNCISHSGEVQEYVAYLNARPDLQNVLLTFDNGLLFSLKLEFRGVSLVDR